MVGAKKASDWWWMPLSGTGLLKPSLRLFDVMALCLLGFSIAPCVGRVSMSILKLGLAPMLQPGDVIILDNLAVHKSAKAHKFIQGKGAWMLFLPPYSPDLNPKNKAFAKLKAHLKTAGMRTFDGLINKIGDICDMFSPQECLNYFKKANYAST